MGKQKFMHINITANTLPVTSSKQLPTHTNYIFTLSPLTDYRRITRFRVKHEGASQRGLRIFA